MVGWVTLLSVWEIKAWIKTATRDARLYMLNPASNAVSLPPSWVAKISDGVVWSRGCNWEDYSLGSLKLFNLVQVVYCLNSHVEINPDPQIGV